MQPGDAHQVCDAGAAEQPPLLGGDGALVADRERDQDARGRRGTEVAFESIPDRLPRLFYAVENIVSKA
jgi:hypothetical protein